MAKSDFPLNIDRRSLLASAVAIPAASIVAIGKPAETAVVGGIRSPAMAPEAEGANVCSVTATRLGEIARRKRPSRSSAPIRRHRTPANEDCR